MPPKKLLIVDDNEDELTLMRIILTRKGFLVETAENGQEALEKVSCYQPDLIYLDLMMPVMDGLEASRHLKTNPATRHIPIILSAVAQIQLERFDVSHIDGFLFRPRDFKSVVALIKELLGEPADDSSS